MNNEELANRYRQMSDLRLEKLANEAYKLTPNAQEILTQELNRRGMELSLSASDNNAKLKKDAQTVNLGIDTGAGEEHKDALKVFYIKEKTLKWRAYLLLILGGLALASQLLVFHAAVFVIGVGIIFFGYYLLQSGDEIPQLILYPDYLLFIPSSNNVRSGYADVYKMYINQNFSRINKSSIVEIVKLNQFVNAAPLAIRVEGNEKPIPLLLVLSGNEVDEIFDLLTETYTT